MSKAEYQAQLKKHQQETGCKPGNHKQGCYCGVLTSKIHRATESVGLADQLIEAAIAEGLDESIRDGGLTVNASAWLNYHYYNKPWLDKVNSIKKEQSDDDE